MNDSWEIPLMIFLMSISVFLFLGLTIISLRWIDLTFFNNINVTAYVEGKSVFYGKNGCLSVHSSGDTTSLQTYKGFLCFFPEKFYVSEDIIVK